MQALFENPFFLIIIALVCLSLFYLFDGGSSKKRRLTVADWAKRQALVASTKKGIQQLRKKSLSKVCLWIGDYKLPDKKNRWLQRLQLLKLQLGWKPLTFLIGLF